MENESKKKKNKKKKNKQAKNTEDTTHIGGTAQLEQNCLAASEQNVHLQISNGGEIDNSGHSESDAKPDQHEHDTKMQEHTLAMLEGELARLESEKNSWLEKKAMLEVELARLESEKKCWLEKEACLEEHIGILEDEKKAWTLEESSIKEMVARLSEANTIFQTEVKELNSTKDQLLQERLELVSRINDLELHIQQLSKLTFHAESQILPQDDDQSVHRGGSNALVEKLMTQNVKLMGEVNELHIRIDQLKSASMAVNIAEFPTSSVIPTQLPATIPTHMHPPQSSEKAGSPRPMNSHLPNHVEQGSENNVIPSEGISSRIQFDEVPVTYDNIEIVEEAEAESKASEEKPSTELVVEEGEVPLSDAPLIGAPFRFLGFVARYVSGADLVKPKNSG
ncbi:uncharacterized protein LOC116262793 isoform X2 [Nymphaea colorata]|uniref:uncharacterized protein LOC116262793 isoform X2 n=1 Tax=Nymphaea colorata TaxID=210225 RepID=UPI00214F1383|nr:uncharacterized protein LOC116262793 isoform X2 [Nymphaea colorata]